MNPLLNAIGANGQTAGVGPLDVFQLTQNMFGTALGGAVTQEVAAGQAAVRLWLHAAVALWVLTTAYLALAQNLPISRLFSRVMRLVIVTALAVDTNLYNQYVVQTITTGIPNNIASAFSGGLNAQNVPGQFSAIYLQVEHLAATLRTQASGLTYIADRISIWMVSLVCKAFLVPQFAVWVVVQAFLYLLAVGGTVVIVFWLFDATKGFAEQWAGTIVGALLATMLMSVVLQIVFLMNGAFMQHIINLPTSDSVNLSVSRGIDVLSNAAVTFMFGLILMVIAIRISFGIGRATGFNANTIMQRLTQRFV